MSFPNDWSYRRKITISGSPGTGTGYQVLFRIGESSGSSDFDFHLDNRSAKFPSQQDDGGDLRFTLDDGTTLLPFWVEKVEGTAPNRTAYVWVKVNADLSADQSIFCYFGNLNAENASNGEETFELFDVQGIAAFYHMDEESWNGTEGEVKDETGVNNGTAYGGATTVENGRFGRAGSFDGSNDYIDCGNPTITGSFTVEVWAKVSDTGWRTIIGTRSPSDCSFDMKFQNGNQIHGDIGNGSTWLTKTADVSFNYELNTWYHIVYVVTPTGYTIYINGDLKGTGSYSTSTPIFSDSGHKIAIGAERVGGSEHFKGLIDEVRIYNRALTEEEISKLYSGYMQNMEGCFNVRKYTDIPWTFVIEDIETVLHTLQGTVCDKNGNPITGTTVKIFLLDKDTGELLKSTTSNSEDGSWSADLWSTSPKTLAVFALEGTYGEDTDIAGAEFLEVE